MAAGVGHGNRIAHVCAGGGGGEGQARRLLHRQGVHVGAQGHDPAGTGAVQDADHPGLADPGADLQPQGPEMIGDDGGRAGLGEAQFGMLVEVAAPVDHLGRHALDGGVHAGRIDGLGLGGTGREQQRQGGDGEQATHVDIP